MSSSSPFLSDPEQGLGLSSLEGTRKELQPWTPTWVLRPAQDPQDMPRGALKEYTAQLQPPRASGHCQSGQLSTPPPHPTPEPHSSASGMQALSWITALTATGHTHRHVEFVGTLWVVR